jgi:hypothetical protein
MPAQLIELRLRGVEQVVAAQRTQALVATCRRSR